MNSKEAERLAGELRAVCEAANVLPANCTPVAAARLLRRLRAMYPEAFREGAETFNEIATGLAGRRAVVTGDSVVLPVPFTERKTRGAVEKVPLPAVWRTAVSLLDRRRWLPDRAQLVAGLPEEPRAKRRTRADGASLFDEEEDAAA